MNFGKLLTAMVTPFDEKGELALNQTTELVEHLIRNHTEGIVVAGTTGESPTLSSEEKVTLFQHVVEVANGRVPVIAGTGSNNTKGTIELTKKAEAAGVDGIMLVAPYYNKPNQAGLYEHFKTIAETTHLPIMIYNIPGRSSVNITADTITKLANIDNVKAVKEASGDLDQITMILANSPKDFLVYSGDDGLTLPVLSIGGHGIVSVAAHVIGADINEMIHAYTHGDVAKAAYYHQKTLPMMRALFAAPNPVPVKMALNHRGIEVGNVRLPLVPLNDHEMKVLLNVLCEY